MPMPMSMSMSMSDDYDAGYRRWRASRAHAELMGTGLPAGIEPFSFVPLDGLETIADRLGLAPDRTLVDLGCGRGGPGLWLADRLRTRLIGIDGSTVAIEDTRARVRLFPGVVSARFEVGDALDTGLPAGCADAVVSVDVIQLTDSPERMLAEAARLLGDSGRLVLTTWENLGGAPDRFPRDLRGLAERAGLWVDAILERPGWMDRQASIFRRAAELVAAGSADPALRDLAEEGERSAGYAEHLRRVVLVTHA